MFLKPKGKNKKVGQMKKQKVELAPELQKTLDEIGDNPLKEPELYKLIETNPRPSEVFKKAAPKLKMSAFKSREVAEFIDAVKNKVTDFFDDDGNPKITEATKDCDMPDFEQAEEIFYSIKEMMETGNVEEVKKIEAKITRLIWKVSGLKKTDLTQWEQELVRVQVQKAAINDTQTALGIQVKN
jgi:hypothetical protein